MRDSNPPTTSGSNGPLGSMSDHDESEVFDILIGSSKRDPEEVEQELDDLIEEVNRSLPTDNVEFDEALIKENLEEILLMLIAMHGETHGKELLSDFTHLLGAQLSPGTVYPSLHALEEEGILSMHAKVRTKEYTIADEEYVRSTIQRTMMQHLAFGMLLYAFLPKL